ncbi:transmembrane protein 177 [Ceratina calcarata]|uniref:Transmembrane protein 177 n=1 Tax=Ceratina calcarata TaxID=156304 RepID=A0AAJ7NFH6_9HYME|nr:transmembrane protein 177 [Ceratina calcarata]XP_017892631.1 transmembrane protein 177 [Ceratina calcarata]XP_017892632.1 transmembrane protein 177 [Ceratina calcarata]XP_017892633.1 transmembrane protein 177 [Ceratina calcarata]XP_017892634.1 transmembrane protein 177 [Ceratina calcarata]XP_017892635.1 transmembrane protein 177 [Ceratina calcarata]XP_017892636.1 transmembrane protein 177 [Ceratina calcarata]XP_026675529.1 transmembrane protein 177 [Ceratina calcarata]XP_026675531.1 tran
MLGIRTITVIGAAVSLKLLPQTVLLHKYRQFRARYGYDSNEVPVQEDIKERFEQVLDDMSLPQDKREKIQLFNVYDIDTFHAGAFWSKYGGLIGVPANFEYTDPENVTDRTISFQNVQYVYDIDAGRQFRTSLVLSENAQKFAIARKVFALSEYDLVFKAMNIFTDVWIGLTAYSIISKRSKTIKKEKHLKFILMGVIAVAVYVMWLFSRDALDDQREVSINKKIIELGPKYVEGGVEYYEKLSSRNKALRILLGRKGTYLFKNNGNETSWFHKKRSTITNQIEFFNIKLRSLQVA